MDSQQRPGEGIDYERAAEQLLIVLAILARKHPREPIPARRLCRPVFGALADRWSHETMRRRIRDAVIPARAQLSKLGQVNNWSGYIVANGQGYWFEGDIGVLKHYRDQRRRRGLRQLGAAAGVTPAIQAAAGQEKLFEDPIPVPQFRH